MKLYFRSLLFSLNKLTLCIFKSVKPCGLSLNLLSLANESFAVLFSLFCFSVSSDNPVLTKLKIKFPVKKNIKRGVKEHADLNIFVDVCC